MKKIVYVLVGLIALIFIIVFVIGQLFFFYGVVLKFIELIFGSLKNLDKGLLATVITGCTAIIVAVISLIVSKYMEYERTLRDNRRPVYEGILVELLKTIQNTSKENFDFLNREYLPKLIAYGSTDVVKFWINYTTSESFSEKDFKNLMNAMGTDLGHKGDAFNKLSTNMFKGISSSRSISHLGDAAK